MAMRNDVDPVETREWLDALGSVLQTGGADRARYLCGRLQEKALRNGVVLPPFAEVTGRDLSHFAKWYEQAGTPRVSVAGQHDRAAGTYRLDLSQRTEPTPGQPAKEPMAIPVALGLVAEDGSPIEARDAFIRATQP